jgi:hypothetical protein
MHGILEADLLNLKAKDPEWDWNGKSVKDLDHKTRTLTNMIMNAHRQSAKVIRARRRETEWFTEDLANEKSHVKTLYWEFAASNSALKASPDDPSLQTETSLKKIAYMDAKRSY